jgi:hypothetical protein
MSYKKKLKQNLKQFISCSSNKTVQHSRDLLSFNITKEFSHGSNSFFSSTHFYESYLFDYDTADEDDDDEDEDEDTIREDSFCSDNFYSDDDDDEDEEENFLITSRNKSNISISSNKRSAFTPSKTSSRKSLLSPETSIIYRNQTLIIDYICNVCNLHLFKGQCIDCEFDETRNKLFLKQDDIFSSTLIANETIKSVKHHKHEIEVNYLLYRHPSSNKNLSYTRVTHF